jgi:predicted HD phosphohydrolase
MLAAFHLGRRRYLVPASDAPGNGLSQAVRRLHQSILKIVSAGERFGQIRKPHVQSPAVALG